MATVYDPVSPPQRNQHASNKPTTWNTKNTRQPMKTDKAYANASYPFTFVPANLTKRASIPLLAALLFLGLLQQAGAQVTLLLSNKWSLAQGSRYYLPNGGDPRGVGMNPLTGHILIPS